MFAKSKFLWNLQIKVQVAKISAGRERNSYIFEWPELCATIVSREICETGFVSHNHRSFCWRLFRPCHTVLYLTTISHCMVCVYLQVSVTVDGTMETLPCGSHDQINKVISSQQPPSNEEENSKKWWHRYYWKFIKASKLLSKVQLSSNHYSVWELGLVNWWNSWHLILKEGIGTSKHYHYTFSCWSHHWLWVTINDN